MQYLYRPFPERAYLYRPDLYCTERLTCVDSKCEPYTAANSIVDTITDAIANKVQ